MRASTRGSRGSTAAAVGPVCAALSPVPPAGVYFLRVVIYTSCTVMESQLRKYTLKFGFSFDIERPKIFDFDDWFFETFKVPEEDVFGVSYDFLSNEYVVKVSSDDHCQNIMTKTNGSAEYKTRSGEVSRVSVTYAGLGLRTVKVHLLPFELDLSYIKGALSKYGTVYGVTADRWSGNLHYKVDNGIRTVKIDLKSHIPSFVNVCGFKALVIYEGQPRTCSACNHPGHLRAECPRRRPPQLPADVGPDGRPRAQYSTVASRLFPREHAVPRPTVDVTAQAATPSVPQPHTPLADDDVEMSDVPVTTAVPAKSDVYLDTSPAAGKVADDTKVKETVNEHVGAPREPLSDNSAQNCVSLNAPLDTPDKTQGDKCLETSLPVAVTRDSSTASIEHSAANEAAVPTSKKFKKTPSGSQKNDTGHSSPETKKLRIARDGAPKVAKELRAIAQQVAEKLKNSPPEKTDSSVLPGVVPMDSDATGENPPDPPWWMDTEKGTNEDQE